MTFWEFGPIIFLLHVPNKCMREPNSLWVSSSKYARVIFVMAENRCDDNIVQMTWSAPLFFVQVRKKFEGMYVCTYADAYTLQLNFQDFYLHPCVVWEVTIKWNLPICALYTLPKILILRSQCKYYSPMHLCSVGCLGLKGFAQLLHLIPRNV